MFMANTNASSKKHQEPNIVWFNKSANLNNPDFYSYMKKLKSTENLGITLSKKLFKCGWTSNSWLEDKKKKGFLKITLRSQYLHTLHFICCRTAEEH